MTDYYEHKLVKHFERMMEAAANYIEPTTYIARHPMGEKVPLNMEFPEPDKNDSSTNAERKTRRRDKAFISDMLYMLDGPEQREAIASIDSTQLLPKGLAYSLITLARMAASAEEEPVPHWFAIIEDQARDCLSQLNPDPIKAALQDKWPALDTDALRETLAKHNLKIVEAA